MIIGDVRDTCQMLPHLDWKAEDQTGARAWTNAGSKNGGDKHKW